ncbi:MAG: sodium:solute symporter family protein, partial [Rickettsiaceae bacterium]|nr:sodium:solute symporter family protein [Rickettsiaceae bacterium]
MNIDSAIFIGFLVVNIILGLGSSTGIKNIKEYAIGNRDFSTASIVSTIVATRVSGSMFFTIISESYNNGLYFIWADAGSVICFLLLGYFFAPRLSEFLGKISIAEAMGDLYGKPVRIITALAGFIGVSGIIAMQLKVSGLLFEYCFNVPSAYGVIIGGIIVTLYSTLGGIKSVTFTDIIQFFTFGTIIPIITFCLLATLDSKNLIFTTLSTNKVFDYNEVFDFNNSRSLYYLFLFFYFAIPGFNPAIFQRISMAKNVNQVRSSFIIAGLTYLLLTLMLYWISILLLSINPNLDAGRVVKHLIFDSSYVGLKGLTLAGIMAMLMSTADSHINSTSVLIVHDFCKPLGINLVKNELTFSRIASLFIGIFAIILCLYSTSLLQLIIMTASFYMPIVTVPFTMSLVGFRSSGKSVLIGMMAGFVTVVIWKIFFTQIGIDGLVPGMLANLVFLLGSHYILQQQGGWVGIKDYGPVLQIRKNRKAKIQNFIKACRNFDLFLFLRKNSPSSGPGGEAIYTYLGLFCMISAFSAMHTIDKSIQLEYIKLLGFIYPSVLLISTLLLAYPLWLASWRNSGVVSILWHIAIFYILICVSFLLVIISKFTPLQLMAFMINFVVIAVLVRWQLALIMIVTGLLLTIQFCKYFLGANYLQEQYAFANFETAYLLLLISSILIAFLKPKQDWQELTQEQKDHLAGRIDAKDAEIKEALALKGEFIRNVSHEYHAPMTGIVSMAETLVE